MKLKLWIILVALFFAVPHFLIAENAQHHSGAAPNAAATAFAKLPLSFEPALSPGHFVARTNGYTLSISATEASVAVKDGTSGLVRMLRYSFDASSKLAVSEGVERLPGVVNYYRGTEPSNWRVGVPTFAKVRAQNVYPGIDVLYYGDQRRLEFDFVVAPNSDPTSIALAFAGTDKLSISSAGDLVAEVGGHQVRFAKPYAYQRIGGQNTAVSVEYALDHQAKARMILGAYDKSQELVIDPVLTYSTFLGGSLADTANGITVDAAGNAYVAGQTCSSDFIVPGANPSGTVFKGALGACDAYVTKLDPTGNTLLYTTFIAGAAPTPPNARAEANGIAVDATGQAYIAGTTNYWDLPLTAPNPPGRFSAYNGGDSDVFISILNADGTLQRETYLGGSNIDQGYGIAVDPQLNVAVSGQTCSSDFPTYNSIQAKVEHCVAFVTKLDYFLHIAPPILPGASPVSPRPTSLTETNCGFGAPCPPPATPSDGTHIYYFFSTIFGGQPLPPEPTWPALNAPSYAIGINVPVGAITIGSPNCTIGDKPQILLAEPGALGPYTAGISGGLVWPCPSVKPKDGVLDLGGFVWLDLGEAPAAVIYATTEAYAVALDPVGDVFAVGGTNTADLTPYLFYAGYHGINYGKTGPWALKLSSLDGSQIYATALGNFPTTDPGQSVNAAKGIAVDLSGRAYIVGTATGGIITTTGTVSGNTFGKQDAFVVKLNTPASAFDYGTYLGGSGDEQGLAIAIDTGGAAYITGSTTSPDLPVNNALLDANSNPVTSLLGPQDAFIAKLTPAGSALTMMAYMGGAASEQGNAITLDKNGKGNIYIAGTTQSVDFPVIPTSPPTPAVLGKSIFGGGTSDGFVALIDGASFPKASVSPASLNFGSQNVGTSSATKAITLQSIGNGILTISSISFSGALGDFSQTNDCGAQLSPAGGAKDRCTITVTFTPTTSGSRSDVLQIIDNSADGPQSVALSGNGVVVQGVIQLSPATLAFGNQQTSTTSAAKSLTLTNTSSTYALTISTITLTGDFKQTNNCPTAPATLASNSSCTIQVTFAPVTAGDQTASLSVAGAATNSPQSIALTGTGTAPGSSGSPDFSLTSSAQSVTNSYSGGTATFNVQANPLNGFKQTLNFTCAVPNGATCTLSPLSLIMDGTSAPSVTVTCSIPGAGVPPVRTVDNRLGPKPILATILPFCIVGMALVGRKRRLMFLLLLVLIVTMMFSVSCGGGGGSSNTSNANNITPGTYQVTVTATSTGTTVVSHSISVTMVVK